jgi:hypothetical protein
MSKPGPKPGYKQTAEHVEKRKRYGDRHPGWKGDDVSVRGGRTRAIREYPPGPCTRCGDPKGERHHVNGDTSDNRPENIAMLCRRCHMATDGRLAEVRERMPTLCRHGEENHVAKLTAEKVREIRRRWEGGESIASLAREFNVTPQSLGAVVHKRSWKHV